VGKISGLLIKSFKNLPKGFYTKSDLTAFGRRNSPATYPFKQQEQVSEKTRKPLRQREIKKGGENE
jgi:hypothetical protein